MHRLLDYAPPHYTDPVPVPPLLLLIPTTRDGTIYKRRRSGPFSTQWMRFGAYRRVLQVSGAAAVVPSNKVFIPFE